jgi:hypothetical protein
MDLSNDIISEYIQQMVKKHDEIIQQMLDKHNIKSIDEVYVEESTIENMLTIVKKSDRKPIGMIAKQADVTYENDTENFSYTAKMNYKYVIL